MSYSGYATRCICMVRYIACLVQSQEKVDCILSNTINCVNHISCNSSHQLSQPTCPNAILNPPPLPTLLKLQLPLRYPIRFENLSQRHRPIRHCRPMVLVVHDPQRRPFICSPVLFPSGLSIPLEYPFQNVLIMLLRRDPRQQFLSLFYHLGTLTSQHILPTRFGLC